MSLIYTLDLIGTFVFAISGMLAAAEKRFDLFGAAVIAFVTAVGGGTVRDLLIGKTPVGWMKDLNYLVCIGSAIPVTLLFRTYIQRLRKTMFLFDTIGIGLFTVLGLKSTLAIGLSPVIALMMGMVSAVFWRSSARCIGERSTFNFSKRNLCYGLYNRRIELSFSFENRTAR